MNDTDPVVCHRCGSLMKPGGPLFYVVRIEAFPIPELPPQTMADLETDFDEELARIVEEAGRMSSQELMDQVYRKLLIHLCPQCYCSWIEDPVG